MNLLEKINSLPKEKQEVLKNRIKTDGDSYGIYKLTGTQYGIWCAYELDSLLKSSFYNICSKLTIKDNISIEKAEAAVIDVVSRHEALLYKFIALDECVYQYVDKDSKISIVKYDASKLSSLEKEKYIKKVEDDIHFYHFNLQKENPIKFKIIKTDEDSFTIYFCIHHIVCDGWSLGVLIKSYLESYFDMEDRKETHGFSKYVIKNKSKDMEEEQRKNLNYWIDKLKDTSEILPLPTNIYSDENNDKGKYIEMPFGKELENNINCFSKTYKFGIQSIILSAFTVVMQRYCNVSALNVGMTMARRSYEYTRNMIGDIASMLVVPLKVDESKDSLCVIKDMNDSLLDGIEHENIVFSDLLNNAVTERVYGIEPLYQVTFAVHSNKLSGGLVDGEFVEIKDSKCMYKYLPSENTEGFNGYLCITVQEKDNGINIQAEYSTKYFSDERIKTILESILYVLNKMIELPEKKISTIGTLKQDISYYSDETIILDNSLNIVPKGFPGNIYYKKDSDFSDTGKFGYLNENNKVYILEEYSRISKYKGNLIDVNKVKEELIKEYNLDECLVYIYNQNVLVVIYAKETLIYEEDVRRLINVDSVLLLRTSSNVENKRYTANKIAKCYLKLQSFNHITRQAFIEKEAKYFLIYETDNKERLTFNDISLIKRYGGCSNLKIGYYENMPIDEKGIITKDINTELIIFPKADKLSKVEEKIKKIWDDILKHRSYTIYDKFYEIGGNSIMMIKMHKEINNTFKININIAELFIYNTVFDLAKYIESEYLSIKENTNSLQGMKF